MKRIISFLLVLALLSGLWVSAEEVPLGIEFIHYYGGYGVSVATKLAEDHFVLYLPAPYDGVGHSMAVKYTDPDARSETQFYPEDALTNFEGNRDKDMYMTLTVTRGDDTLVVKVDLIPVDGIANLFLTSDDPVNQGREWVESSPTKSNSATGSMILMNEAGDTVYNGDLTQIKGRGNSTWLADKKPYQIKLDEKTDLLETGDKANVSKTWVLLTNHSDPTLLRNKTVYDLSVDMGMDPGIQCRPVNLYYDGEYRGLYLLCEKVEIKSGRVDIEDLEGAIEDANPDIDDFDALPVTKGTTANGASYLYCPDLKSPEDITGGFLLELETAARAVAEKCYIITSRNTYIVVKSPEYCSKEAMDYIATYYQEFEDTLYNKGVHPTNGKTLSDYADIHSLAQCYIINELTKNPDGYRTSCYFYKEAGDSILMAGPIWDYDLSFGRGWGMFIPFCAETTRFFTLHTNFSTRLYDYGPFRQAVHDIYLDRVSPLITEKVLPRLAEDRNTLLHSALANDHLWKRSGYNAECDRLIDYIRQRNDWLTEAYASWNSETAEPLNQFQDVREGDWYYEVVNEAAGLGLINGIGFGIFAPQGTATRAQATKILWAMEGAPEDFPASEFEDVPDTAWFASAIAWAKAEGVVNGYSDGGFGPNDSITRQDLVTIIYRHSGESQEELTALGDFTDGETVSSYARAAMAWAIENGILTGYNDATLKPKKNVTRAEMTAIMVRYCNIVGKT